MDLRGTAVLRLQGELDIASRPMLEERLKELVHASVLIVDLTQTTYLDSTVLDVLVRVCNERKLTPGSMLVVPSKSADVRRLFRITNLDRTLPFTATLR